MLSTRKRIRGDILRFSKVCNRLVDRESDVGMWFCNWFWSYVRFTSGEQWCIGVQGMADLTIWKTIYDYLDRRMLKDLLASKMQH